MPWPVFRQRVCECSTLLRMRAPLFFFMSNWLLRDTWRSRLRPRDGCLATDLWRSVRSGWCWRAASAGWLGLSDIYSRLQRCVPRFMYHHPVHCVQRSYTMTQLKNCFKRLAWAVTMGINTSPEHTVSVHIGAEAGFTYMQGLLNLIQS